MICSNLNVLHTKHLQMSCKALQALNTNKCMLTSPERGKVHTLPTLQNKVMQIKRNAFCYKGMQRFETFRFQMGSVVCPLIVTKVVYPTMVLHYDDEIATQLNNFCKMLESETYSNLSIDDTLMLTIYTKFWTENRSIVCNPFALFRTFPKILAIIEPFFSHNVVKFKVDQICFLQSEGANSHLFPDT